MSKSEQELTSIVESHLLKVNTRINNIKTDLQFLHLNKKHLQAEIFPIYEKMLNLTGDISELKIAFRLRGTNE